MSCRVKSCHTIPAFKNPNKSSFEKKDGLLGEPNSAAASYYFLLIQLHNSKENMSHLLNRPESVKIKEKHAADLTGLHSPINPSYNMTFVLHNSILEK